MSFVANVPNMNANIARNVERAESKMTSSADKLMQETREDSMLYCELLSYDMKEEEACRSPPPSYHESRRNGLRSSRSAMHLNRSLQQECPAYYDVTVSPLSNEQRKSPFLLDLFVGQKMAKKWTNKRDVRRQQRLEHVHDAWLKLGLDTRQIVNEGRFDQLPPYFWTPPRYDAAEMNRRLGKLGL